MKFYAKYIAFFLMLFMGLWLIGCSDKAQDNESKSSSNGHDPEEVSRDLPQIKHDSVLRVITTYNPTSYFIYRGEPMGYEYDMAGNLADHLGLKMEVIVAKNFNEVFELLNSGKGDIISFGLTITKDRKKRMAFTDPLYTTHQVLVQRKPDNWRRLPGYKVENQLIKSPYELIGDTVYIGKGTSYYSRLENLEGEIGGDIHIKQLAGDVTTNDIINMVAKGEIDYTVADDNLASVDKTFHPILDTRTKLSLDQRIAWGVRKNSPELLKAVNDWIHTFKKESLYYVLYNKYFKNSRAYRPRLSSALFSLNTGNLSPYDGLIRKGAEKLGWDWRLLAAQVYQESQFDPNSTGYLGSAGLLQLMPATAKELGVKNLYDPAENIKGATTYLKKLSDRFAEVKDSVQRIKFTMAAFNSGPSHVDDAQRLAESLGDNPLRWDNNVEKAMLKLQQHKYYTRPEVKFGFAQGNIPYNYVRDIFDRYEEYSNLILLSKEDGTAHNDPD